MRGTIAKLPSKEKLFDKSYRFKSRLFADNIKTFIKALIPISLTPNCFSHYFQKLS